MRRPYGRFTIIIQHKLLLLAIKCKLNAENELAIIVFFQLLFKPPVITRGSGVTGAFGCNRGVTGASSPAGDPCNLCAGASAPAGGQNSASV